MANTLRTFVLSLVASLVLVWCYFGIPPLGLGFLPPADGRLLNALIKVKTFDMVSNYKLDAGGRPRLASQTADSVGSVFGFTGGETSEVTFTYR